MFLCLPLELASQKERRHRLINLHVWNTIFSELLIFSSLFILRIGCNMPSLGEMYGLSKVCFDQRASQMCFHHEYLD